jgi:hypothetical protein
MAKYNGHPSYNAWNVSLWINNDEGLYAMAKDNIQWWKGQRNKAAQAMFDQLIDCGITHTPDGVRYTVTNIRRAMVDM